MRNRDRTHFRPWGILGGDPAEPSNLIVNPGSNREKRLGNTDIFVADPGDVVHIRSPGGGGRGSSFEREPERVLVDVLRGYISAERALTDYGVAIVNARVDANATRVHRVGRLAQPPDAPFRFGPEREAFEAVWTPAQYDLMTVIMAVLPVHWRFVKTKLFEAIRAAIARGDGADIKVALANVRAAYPQVPDV